MTETPASPPTPESPKESEPPKEPEKPGEAVPLKVEDLKLPEGAELDKEAAEGFLSIANELKLPAEATQKLFDYGNSLLAKAQEAGSAAFVATNEQWVKECKADTEFGGEKLEGTLNQIGKLLDNPKFADPGLRQALLVTGAGNNPAMFRTMARIAAALTEGAPVTGTPAKVDRPQSFGEALYGKQPQG